MGEQRAAAWRRRLTPLGLFGLAFAIRALPWPTVFTQDRIELFGYDAYYHLRRVLYSAANFPALLDFDPYLKFPHGARPIWPPFFDGALAALTLPFYRPGDPASLERVAVWIPPLLGAATVVALYAVARRALDDAVATLSALLLCVLSAHTWYSQLGFVDHHAAVALIATLLLGAGMQLLRVLAREPAAPPRERGAALATAIAAAGLLLCWPGGLLHVVLLESGFVLFVALRPTRRAAVRCANAVALQAAIAAAILLPAAARGVPEAWTPMSAVVLSRFQPWLFAVLALHALGVSLASRHPALGRSTASRFGASAALGALLLVASALLFPDLLLSLREAWTWLFKAEDFQAMVGESLPLFVAKGHFTTEIAELRLSRLVYLFPMALAAFVGWARQREDRASLWLLAGWALGLGLVTLLQRRFMNCFSVALALVTGWAAVALFRAAGRLSGRAARTAAALALACVLLFLLAPVRRAYDPLLRNAARALRGQSPIPDRSRSQKLGPLQVAEWMREATPETSGFLDASRRPEYGVLAPWGDGHVLQYVGRRPTVVDNFGDDLGPENFLASRRYFGLASEEEAAALLEELRVRYVVVRPSAALSGPMFHRLYAEDGAGLGRHRMVYETPFAERTAHLPSIKVFELVAGARVVGRAPPGERVRATLSLWTPRRRTAFASETLADEDGRYALRLPYATRGAPPSCRPDEAYVVEAAGRSHPLVVDERAVRQGLELPGPDLRR